MNRLVNPETRKRIHLLFAQADWDTVESLLSSECGNNLPFLEELDELQLERYRFAALKLSSGKLPALTRAIELAKTDWRDLLMGAGSGHNVDSHRDWLPSKPSD